MEFKNIFKLVNLHVGVNARSESMPEFIDSAFQLLDNWALRASDNELSEAWAHTKLAAPTHPYFSIWWQRSPKNPQIWSTEDFFNQVTPHATQFLAKHIIERLQLATQQNEWNFFDPWGVDQTSRLIKKLCKFYPHDPTVAIWLGHIQTHKPKDYAWICSAIPVEYIHNHAEVASHFAPVIVQNQIAEHLDLGDLDSAIKLMQYHRSALQTSVPLINFPGQAWAMRQWGGRDDTLTTCKKMVEFWDTIACVFPNDVDQVGRGFGTQNWSYWDIANAVHNKPEFMHTFVHNMCEKMLGGLFTLPHIEPWTEFFEHIHAMGYIPQNGAAYTLAELKGVVPHVHKMKVLERTVNWEALERCAPPRLIRALAAVVEFSGGTTPSKYCQFKDVFNFTSVSEAGTAQDFQEFVQARTQHNVIAQSVAPSQLCKSRKI